MCGIGVATHVASVLHGAAWPAGASDAEDLEAGRAGEVIRRRPRLIQRRKTIGYTQEKFAEELGVDRTTVVRWERAESEPQPWQRPKLAALLKVSPEELDRKSVV